MTRHDSLEGIIFRVGENNPTDKLVHLLTKDGDKVVLLAKNIKSPTSKRLQLTAIGNYVNAKYVKGYGIPLLTDISAVNEFLKWKNNFRGMIYLQLMCEILSFFSFENNTEPELFSLFIDILSTNPERAEYLSAIFAIKILNLTGNLPELNKDANTNEDISSSNAVLNIHGIGYVKDRGQGYLGDERIYKVQRFIIENSPERAMKINLSSSEESKLLNLHLNWIESVVDKQIKSREVLRGMGLL